MRSRIRSLNFTTSLAFLVAVQLFIFVPQASPQAKAPNDYKIGDLVGRWERWPDNIGEKGVQLFAYGYDDGNGQARMHLNISVAEQYAYGPDKPGTEQFKGRFDPEGFDLFYDCLASEYCGNKPQPGAEGFKRLRSRKDSGVVGKYRYNVKFLRKDLLLVTAYSPLYKYSGNEFVGIEQEARVRRFYLTRNDTCEKSKDLVRRQVIDGEFGDRFLLALGEPKPLPVGTVVEENTPQPREIFRLDKQGCFVFVDLVPTARWSHPVLYLLVDEKNEEIIGRELGGAPPLLTVPDRNEGKRTEYYYDIRSRIESPDLLFPTLDRGRERNVLTPPVVPGPIGPVSAGIYGLPVSDNHTRVRYLPARMEFQNPSFPADCSTAVPKKRALIINGGKNKGFDAEAERYVSTFKSLGFDIVAEHSWRESSLEEVRGAIGKLAEGLGACDVFTVYIVSHSLYYFDPEYTSDADISFHSSFKDFNIHPWSLFNLESNKFSDTGQNDTGPGLLWELRYVDAGYINVILDECYSERLIQAAVDEDYGGPPIAKFLDEGQRLALFTSASWNETSGIVDKDLNIFYQWLVDTYLEVGTAFSAHLAKEIDNAVGRGLHDTNKDGIVDRDEYEVIMRMAMTATSGKVREATSLSKTLTTQTPRACTIIGTLNECFEN